jgi:hypothetical protein
MLKSTLTATCLSALAGAVMTLSMTPASAFTLASPFTAQSMADAQIDHVWYDAYGRWHPNGYGYARPYGYGVVHPYAYRRHCWRGAYGQLHCN